MRQSGQLKRLSPPELVRLDFALDASVRDLDLACEVYRVWFKKCLFRRLVRFCGFRRSTALKSINLAVAIWQGDSPLFRDKDKILNMLKVVPQTGHQPCCNLASVRSIVTPL